MTEPKEDEPHQWNEARFIKRLIEAVGDPERAISQAELPLSLNLPSLNRVGDRAMQELEPRTQLHVGTKQGFDIGGNQGQTECFFIQIIKPESTEFDALWVADNQDSLSASILQLESMGNDVNGLVYAEKHGHMAYLHLMMQTLNHIVCARREIIFQRNQDDHGQKEGHLVIRTKELNISPEKAQTIMDQFHRDCIKEARSNGYDDANYSTPENKQIFFNASQKIWLQYAEKYGIAYYAGVDSDTLSKFTSDTIRE
ncbi:MAG: hypothetical protein V1898_04525 [Patescibacteria group bacterium]